MMRLPFAVTDPSKLLALPPYYSEVLFSRSEVMSWYVADLANLTIEALFGVDRVPGWADMSPNNRDLLETGATSLAYYPEDADLNNNSYVKPVGNTNHYDWPGTWPTGDHSKVVLFKAPTPTSNKFMISAGSGEGQNLMYLSTLDKVLSNIDGSTISRTRNPSRWNLFITSWDATGRIQASLLDQEGFESIAAVGTADCGSTSPKIGTNGSGTTGANDVQYREIAFLNVALHKPANADLLTLILGRFKTYYGIELAP